MKKYALTLLVFLSVFFAKSSFAQDSEWKPIARGQSDKGQWVVAKHKEASEKQLISFYSKDNVLMYREEMKTSKINVNREKVIKGLNQLLRTIALEWEHSKSVASNALVANHFN